MFERILIPVDGSTCARRAAAFGLTLAKQYGAAVEVVHAHRGDEERGREALDAAAEMAAELDVAAETELIEGKPPAAIAKRAADGDVDLVVMGTEGRSGLRDRLLGSVTERVLRRTDAPVLVVPDGDLERDTGSTYGDVLVTTDGSDLAEQAGPYASDVARQFGATLHLLAVVDVQSEAGVFDAGGVDREYVERLESKGRDAVSRLAERVDEDVDTRSSVVRGSPAEEIAAYVADNGVDLIVMSSEGESNLADQLLGSVTGGVLRSADVPVLVVVA
jgi:nucleotide-binding universal stress UspA family protein